MEDVRLRITEKEVLTAMDCDREYFHNFLQNDQSITTLYKEFVENHPDRRGFRKVVKTRHIAERAGNVIGYNDTRVLVATNLSKLSQVDLYVRFVAGLVQSQLKPGGIWEKWPVLASVDQLCYRALMILRYLESRGPVPSSLQAPNGLVPKKPLSYQPAPTSFDSPSPDSELTQLPTHQPTPMELKSPSPFTDSTPPPMAAAPRTLRQRSWDRKRKFHSSESTSPVQEGPHKRTDFSIKDGLFVRTFIPEKDRTAEPNLTLEEQIEILMEQIAARNIKKSNKEEIKHSNPFDEAKKLEEAGKKRIEELERKIAERDFNRADTSMEDTDPDGETDEEVSIVKVFYKPKSSTDFFKRTF